MVRVDSALTSATGSTRIALGRSLVPSDRPTAIRSSCGACPGRFADLYVGRAHSAARRRMAYLLSFEKDSFDDWRVPRKSVSCSRLVTARDRRVAWTFSS